MDQNWNKMWEMPNLRKIGHITPSSNTAVEAVTMLMNLAVADRISHHFSRIEVKGVALSESSDRQFTNERMVAAAQILADAPLDAIVWNGTAGSWRGVEQDQAIVGAITKRTGIPASTSTLALLEAFEEVGARRIALAVPYVKDLTDRIGATYRKHGYEVVSSAHLGQSENSDIGSNSRETIRKLLRDADSPDADAIAVVCTNVPAALIVEEMEQELGKPILDSIAVTFWKGCRLAGETPLMPGWGRLLAGSAGLRSRVA